MDLLEGYYFSNATDDYKARCFTTVFIRLNYCEINKILCHRNIKIKQIN